MDNIIAYLLSFGWIFPALMGLLGLFLGYIFWGRQKGDLSLEGETQLRTDADGLHARIKELEGHVSTRDTELTDLRANLTGGEAPAPAADDDESYALEWRNRYLAARVKYLEGRISDAPKAKKTAAKKRVVKKVVKKKVAPAKKKAPAKKISIKKAAPKKVAKPRVLYDKPTDGKPDDLKLISGVGPKLEKMLNGTGVYYFKQMAAWNKGNVKMVNDKLGAFPGRIERDEWVRQAKGLAKGAGAKVAAKKPTAKKAPAKEAAVKKAPAKKAKTANPNEKYYAGVHKFDAKASKSVIDNIVKYCGSSLKSRDASLVACTDEKELARVAKGFCTKKLGMTSGQNELVADVCKQMKSQRLKNRVTFYYLCAKKARKMGMFK
jgi:predicted flap endonuclease-1-like 5' DNA nuclease